LFDRHQGGEKALLVHIVVDGISSDLAEFSELVASAGVDICDTLEGSCHVPQPKYFIGSGKAQEIKQLVAAICADVVIINHDLSPSQERNLEKLIQCRVLSRSGLILDIFAQRARTFEGKLQVELAQLQHLQTRLIRGWTHLERQKGGIGLRGPGETQLETDRRLLRERIKSIESRLAKVRLQREENRRSRKKSQLPVVSLVGYTNAGKSSLFNKLTNNQSVAEDKLFATLDPLMRKITLPNNGGVILADTVGFIQDLPHQLVEAFKGTLEETKGADLLLHVVDLSSENYRQHIEVVNQVLAEIGAQKIPIILIYNKIDLLSGVKADYQIAGQQHSVWLSAETGEGIAELLAGIFKLFYGEVKQYELILQPHHGKARALLYQKDAVVSEYHTDDGQLVLKVKLSTKDHQEVQALLG
jgi:GTP-binding protein HflX